MASDAMARAWDRIEAHFVLSRPPILDRQLAQLAALPGLAADTVIAPRPTAIFDIVRDAEGVAVLYNKARITFPARVEEPLRFAVQTPRYRVRDIPGNLDETGKLVLVRRLIREGLLTVEK